MGAFPFKASEESKESLELRFAALNYYLAWHAFQKIQTETDEKYEDALESRTVASRKLNDLAIVFGKLTLGDPPIPPTFLQLDNHGNKSK